VATRIVLLTGAVIGVVLGGALGVGILVIIVASIPLLRRPRS
jgi:hypothetical protein